MKLGELYLSNIMSYKELVFDFASIGSCAISGENGSGKSSIPLALNWILYGETRNSVNDSIIRDGEDYGVGSIEIQDSSDQWWLVERSYSRINGGSFTLYNQDDDGEWVGWSDHLQRSTKDMLATIVPLSFDAFSSLTLFEPSPEGSTRFTRARSTERRSILYGLIPDLDRWNDWFVKADTLRKDCVKAYDDGVRKREFYGETKTEHQERLTVLRKALGECESTTSLRKRHKSFQEALKSLEKQLEGVTAEQKSLKDIVAKENAEKRQELELLQGQLDKAESDHENNANAIESYDRIDELTDRLNGIQNEIRAKKSEEPTADFDADEAARVQSMIDKLDEDLRAFTRQHDEIALRADALDTRIGKLNSIDTAECPTCGSDLTDAHRSALIDELSAEMDALDIELEKKGKELDDLTDKRKSLSARLSDYSSRQKAYQSRMSRFNAELSQLETKKARVEGELEAARNAVSKIRANRETLVKRQFKLNDQIKDIKNQIDEVSRRKGTDITTRVNELQGAALELKRSISDAQRNLDEQQKRIDQRKDIESKIASQMESIDSYESKIRDQIEANKELGKKVTSSTWLAQALSKKGGPSMMVDSVLRTIEERQNQILDGISVGEPMSIEFRQFRKNKTNNRERDVLDLIVHIGDLERPIETFSFGEKVILSLSFTFAMIQTFNELHNGLVSTIFLDEPLGVLDSKRVPIVISALEHIIQSIKDINVVIITHDQRVIDMMPNLVHVVKDGKESRVELELNR